MYDVGSDRRWEPRQSWYDYLYESMVIGPSYLLVGLLSLLVIPFIVLYAWLSGYRGGSLFEEFCFGMWMSFVYLVVGLFGIIACPFLVIYSFWDEYFGSGRV